jgi:parallel beta-helix repeat protein
MKKVCTSILVLVLVSSCFLTLALSAKAASPKTIVVPDNYASIQEAINAAHNGDTILVKAGTYEGATNQTITINKAITLVGEDANATIINLHPQEVWGDLFGVPMLGTNDAIRIESNNVKISGLTIVTPSGIAILGDKVELSSNILVAVIYGQGNEVSIVGNSINGEVEVVGSNQIILQNTINGYVLINGNYNSVLSNVISASNAEAALDIRTNSNFVFNNTISNNGFPGIKFEYRSSYNIIVKNDLSTSDISLETDCSNNTIYGNNFRSISLMGFNNTFFANDIAYVVNLGGCHGGTRDTAYNRFYHNNFLGIYHQNFLGANPELMIYTKNLGPVSWDNGADGNFWSQYQGLDSNNDGIGDSPYAVTASYAYYDGTNRDNEIINCGQDNFPLMSLFDVSNVHINFPSWAPTLSVSSLLPYSVESNSTITGLTFNSQKKELSFNVSGLSGTTGYANVTIAKSYLPNHDKIKVFIDKNQVDFDVSETDDSWILPLNYLHSTHQVRIGFLAAPETVDFLGITLSGWIIAIILVATILSILTAIVRKKAKTNKT